jgi:hypothetical protein
MLFMSSKQHLLLISRGQEPLSVHETDGGFLIP